MTKDEHISISIPIQIVNHLNYIFEEVNSLVSNGFYRVLQAMDQNHLKKLCSKYSIYIVVIVIICY